MVEHRRVVADGSLYYTDLAKRQIYRATMENGGITSAEPAGLELGGHAFPSPDGSFMVLDSASLDSPWPTRHLRGIQKRRRDLGLAATPGPHGQHRILRNLSFALARWQVSLFQPVQRAGRILQHLLGQQRGHRPPRTRVAGVTDCAMAQPRSSLLCRLFRNRPQRTAAHRRCRTAP